MAIVAGSQLDIRDVDLPDVDQLDAVPVDVAQLGVVESSLCNIENQLILQTDLQSICFSFFKINIIFISTRKLRLEIYPQNIVHFRV